MTNDCTTTVTVTCGSGSSGGGNGGGSTTSGSAARNLLINARGQINQREYVSGQATTVANQYTVDRWRVVTQGQSLTWTENEGTKTFTAPSGGVEQLVEGDSILTGTYVISFTGTASCTVDGVAKASGDTVDLTGGTVATVQFTNGTFSLPQLELGTTPTSFELRPAGIERDLCQRYFFRLIMSPSGEGVMSGQCSSATTGAVIGHLPTNMRVPPNEVANGNIQVSNATGQTPSANITAIASTTSAYQVNFNNASGLVAGNATIMSGDSGAGGGSIDFIAEL